MNIHEQDRQKEQRQKHKQFSSELHKDSLAALRAIRNKIRNLGFESELQDLGVKVF